LSWQLHRAVFQAVVVRPEHIFQFFVFDDRVFQVKVGTAFNQVLQVVAPRLVTGPVGLDDHAARGLPTLEESRRLVAETRKTKALSLESAAKSREISVAEIESAELHTKGFFSKGLHFKLRSNEKLTFRFLDESQEEAAGRLLARVLGGRYKG